MRTSSLCRVHALVQIRSGGARCPTDYRLESLPRGPSWSDVQKLLRSCAGDRPTEIRDHAMLLLTRCLRFAKW